MTPPSPQLTESKTPLVEAFWKPIQAQGLSWDVACLKTLDFARTLELELNEAKRINDIWGFSESEAAQKYANALKERDQLKADNEQLRNDLAKALARVKDLESNNRYQRGYDAGEKSVLNRKTSK